MGDRSFPFRESSGYDPKSSEYLEVSIKPNAHFFRFRVYKGFGRVYQVLNQPPRSL